MPPAAPSSPPLPRNRFDRCSFRWPSTCTAHSRHRPNRSSMNQMHRRSCQTASRCSAPTRSEFLPQDGIPTPNPSPATHHRTSTDSPSTQTPPAEVSSRPPPTSPTAQTACRSRSTCTGHYPRTPSRLSTSPTHRPPSRRGSQCRAAM